MKKLLLAALVLVLLGSVGWGQNVAPARATAAAPTYVEGSRVPLSVDLSGKLRTDSTGGGAGRDVNLTGINGTAPGAANPLRVDPTGSTTQPVSGTVTSNQGGTWTVQPGNTANTTPWLSTINQGGNSATVSAGGALKVDNSAVTQPVSGTVTVTDGAGPLNVIVDSGSTTVTQATGTNLHMVCDSGCGGAATFADNAAFTFGTTPINVTGFVLDDTAPNAATENSAAAPRMSANRVPYSQIRDAAGNERGVNVTAGNALVVDGSASTQPVSGTVTATQATASNLNAQVQGAAATDAAVAGNPVLAGCRAEDSVDAAPGVRVSAEGDAVPCSATRDGAVRVVFGGAQSWSYHENSSAALTDTTVHAAAGAGLFNYICTVVFSTGAATAFNLFIEDGTTTTILGPYYLEAVNGRGAMLNFSPCKKQTTANAAITVTTSAAIAHSIDITGYVAE